MSNITEEKYLSDNTDGVRFGVLFPDFIIQEQTGFTLNKELYTLCKKLEEQGHKNIAQRPELSNNSPKNVYKTLGGYQTEFDRPLTDLTAEQDNISKDDELLLKKFQTEVLNKYINFYTKKQFPGLHPETKIPGLSDKTELIYNSWFIRYDKDAFQLLHTHGFKLFTMVYFCKIPKNMKLIGQDLYEGTLIVTNTKSEYQGLRTANIVPEEGKIVIFPGEYPHYTLPVLSDEDRVVIVEDVYIKQY